MVRGLPNRAARGQVSVLCPCRGYLVLSAVLEVTVAGPKPGSRSDALGSVRPDRRWAGYTIRISRGTTREREQTKGGWADGATARDEAHEVARPKVEPETTGAEGSNGRISNRRECRARRAKRGRGR